VSIHILISSDADQCYAPGLVSAIKQFTRAEAQQINVKGGIAGHPLHLELDDDFEDSRKTISNISAALDDDKLVAMIGVSSSTRGKALFDAIGNEIGGSDVPFITEISLNTLFAPYRNVFTLASSVDNELDVLQTFIKSRGFKRPAFIGLKDHLYSKALGDGLKVRLATAPLVADHRIKVEKYILKDEQAAELVASIRQSNPDLLVLGIQSGAGGQLLQKLVAAKIEVPIFIVLGRISRIMRRAGKIAYHQPIYQYAWDGVPNAYNERLRRRIWRSGAANWIFDDLPLPLSTEEWNKRNCKHRKITPLNVLDDRNRRAIGRGAQYRDMLALIYEAARSAPRDAGIPALRRHINRQIRRFSRGSRVLRGWWQDWSFTKTRASAADTLIITRPGEDAGTVLADTQYARVNGRLEPRPVVYLSLDLISISRINTNDRSFDAEFYLSMKRKDAKIGIKSIDFTNAYRSQSSRTRLISWHEIHSGGGGTNFPKDVKLYKVSGKFTFHPDLSHYPFDTQRLSISFQSVSTIQPFLIQPPSKSARASDFEIDGWRALDQYVGSDQDIIPTIDKHVSQKRIVPFYKFNYSWVVKRIAVDYYLRVVVPLAFILMVTYFSVFLNHRRFESIMAIQVTALLSAIALYLALPKVDSDQATLSDKIFMITYAAVSMMIGLSILKDSKLIGRIPRLHHLVSFMQLIVFPIAAISMYGYIMFGPPSSGIALVKQVTAYWNGVFG